MTILRLPDKEPKYGSIKLNYSLRYGLEQEVIDWLGANTKGEVRLIEDWNVQGSHSEVGPALYFESDIEATLFKLFWF